MRSLHCCTKFLQHACSKLVFRRSDAPVSAPIAQPGRADRNRSTRNIIFMHSPLLCDVSRLRIRYVLPALCPVFYEPAQKNFL